MSDVASTHHWRNGLVCTCSVTLRPNEPMVLDKSHCPIHAPKAKP